MGSSKKGFKDEEDEFIGAEIGSPTNFEHKGHIGWDPENGFQVFKINIHVYITCIYKLCDCYIIIAGIYIYIYIYIYTYIY